MKRPPRLDFLAPARPCRWIGWSLLVLGTVALALALVLAAPRPGHSAPERTAKTGTTDTGPPGPPWARLFALEAAHGRGAVTLLSLQPLGDPALLRLQARAADPAAMLAWLSQLEGDQRLEQVTLLHHEWRMAPATTQGRPVTQGAPGASSTLPQVHFEIQARWRAGDTPG